MSRTVHMCIDIFGALKKSNRELDESLMNAAGISLSGKEVREFLENHALTGKRYFVGCDNQTDEGRCAGHEEEIEG